MIHGNSNDPVLIKRIGLKVWTLKDEIENVVISTLKANPQLKELDAKTLQAIKEEYTFRDPSNTPAGLSLVPEANEEEDLEAEMAAAIANGDGDEEEEDLEAEMAAAIANGDEGEEDLEAEMAAAIANPDEGEGSKGPKEGGPVVPVQIIQRSSSIIPPARISRGITVLSELSMESLYFFGSENFMEGQSIVIEFQIPKRFVVNAKVSYCRPFNIRSRIISDKKVSYRVVAQFSFLKEGERTLLRHFIQSIEPEIPVAPITKPKVEKDDDDGDDFDGLDF